jgi:hypothetical protein
VTNPEFSFSQVEDHQIYNPNLKLNSSDKEKSSAELESGGHFGYPSSNNNNLAPNTNSNDVLKISINDSLIQHEEDQKRD